MGKDILRFHAVYWPAFLMSAGLPLPTTVWAHGWWLRDAKKMSKSVGNVVRPDDLVARFGPDALRYYLLREMVFGQDANFSDEAFVDRFNSDLANDLGNTASRVVTVTRGAFGGRTPPLACDDNPLIPVARQVVADYREAMDALAFQDALRALWRLLAEANQYLVVREPWKMIKAEGATDALVAHPLERARGGAHRRDRPAAVHADGGAPGARGGGHQHRAGEPRRHGLGRDADRRAAAGAGAALPENRQGEVHVRNQLVRARRQPLRRRLQQPNPPAAPPRHRRRRVAPRRRHLRPRRRRTSSRSTSSSPPSSRSGR